MRQIYKLKTNSLSWWQGIRHTIVTNNRCTAFHKEDYHLCFNSAFFPRNQNFQSFPFQSYHFAWVWKNDNAEGASDGEVESAHPICSLVEAPKKTEASTFAASIQQSTSCARSTRCDWQTPHRKNIFCFRYTNPMKKRAEPQHVGEFGPDGPATNEIILHNSWMRMDKIRKKAQAWGDKATPLAYRKSSRE